VTRIFPRGATGDRAHPQARYRHPHDSFGGLQRKAAGKHGNAPEQFALLRRQQVVAPVDQRAQRLLAGRPFDRRRQKAKAIGQAIGDVLNGQRAAPVPGQLDRERNAIQAMADVND